MHPKRLFLVVCVLSLALLACKNGGSGGPATPEASSTPEATPTPAGTTVASDDGKLSIFIPKGAMPEGTDVSITSVAHDQLPVELSQLVGSAAGYKLEPDGLTFSQPATAALTIDRGELDDPEGAQSAYALVSFNETAGREVLDSDTAWSVGGDSANVTAQLQHLSWITRTKGSLRVLFEVVPREQAVGERIIVNADVRNMNRGRIAFDAFVIEWSSTGALVYDDPFGSPARRDDPADMSYFNDKGSIPAVGRYLCDHAGNASYTMHVEAISKVIDQPGSGTRLSITLDSVIDCLAPGVATSTPPLPGTYTPSPPPPTETPAGGTVLVTSTDGCAHTEPGVESEVRTRVSLEDLISGRPVAGARVNAEAQGPALLQNTASGVTGANGEVVLSFVITAFGRYDTTVVAIFLPNGTPAEIDPTSVLQAFVFVGETCTPP